MYLLSSLAQSSHSDKCIVHSLDCTELHFHICSFLNILVQSDSMYSLSTKKYIFKNINVLHVIYKSKNSLKNSYST